MNESNESNEAYARRMAAGRLLLEAPQGAQFQRKGINRPWDIWENIPPEHVLTSLFGCTVRIAPTPKKVLRPVGEILDEAGRRKQLTVVQNVVSIIEGGQVWYIADLLTQVVVEQNAPEWFFTTEEPNR
jgi:hypothetical protein